MNTYNDEADDGDYLRYYAEAEERRRKRQEAWDKKDGGWWALKAKMRYWKYAEQSTGEKVKDQYATYMSEEQKKMLEK